MACACSRCDAGSDCNWLTVGHYSLLMPTRRLCASKDKAKSHVMTYQPLKFDLCGKISIFGLGVLTSLSPLSVLDSKTSL